jgi:hypothetical protein
MNSTKGYFDLVVKAYPAGAGDGVSSYITSLKPGDDITVKGCFTKKKIEANQYKSIGMIAGGSGLTPMLQVAQELLNIVEDETKLSLLFCNVTPADIYLKAELDELAELFPERFSVTYARQPNAPMCSNACLLRGGVPCIADRVSTRHTAALHCAALQLRRGQDRWRGLGRPCGLRQRGAHREVHASPGRWLSCDCLRPTANGGRYCGAEDERLQARRGRRAVGSEGLHE